MNHLIHARALWALALGLVPASAGLNAAPVIRGQ
jgi:hypothetical protein